MRRCAPHLQRGHAAHAANLHNSPPASQQLGKRNHVRLPLTEFKQPPCSPNGAPRAPRPGPGRRCCPPTAGRPGPTETSARAPPGYQLKCGRDAYPESPRMITFNSTFFLEVILQAGREKAHEQDGTARGAPPLVHAPIWPGSSVPKPSGWHPSAT